MTHPVCVTAVPGHTPTSPVTWESVHVTAVPARMAKLAVDDCGAGADAVAAVVAITAHAMAAERRIRRAEVTVLIRRPYNRRRLSDVSYRTRRGLREAGSWEREAGSYSARSATSGSIRDARRAGRYPASVDTIASTSSMAANVAGSVAVTPNSRPLSEIGRASCRERAEICVAGGCLRRKNVCL